MTSGGQQGMLNAAGYVPPGGGPPAGFGPPGAPPGGLGSPGGPPGFGAPPPQPGGFGAPPAQQPGFGGGPQAGFDDPYDIPTPFSNGIAIALGVVAVLVACLPGGIIAIVLANQAKNQHAGGDYAGAKSKLTWSYVVSGISLVIGLPLFLMYVFG